MGECQCGRVDTRVCGLQKKKAVSHLAILKGSYGVAKNNIILCIWCNAMCLHRLRAKKHIIFHILYTIVAPLCSARLEEVGQSEAHQLGSGTVPM